MRRCRLRTRVQVLRARWRVAFMLPARQRPGPRQAARRRRGRQCARRQRLIRLGPRSRVWRRLPRTRRARPPRQLGGDQERRLRS